MFQDLDPALSSCFVSIFKPPSSLSAPFSVLGMLSLKDAAETGMEVEEGEGKFNQIPMLILPGWILQEQLLT